MDWWRGFHREKCSFVKDSASDEMKREIFQSKTEQDVTASSRIVKKESEFHSLIIRVHVYAHKNFNTMFKTLKG